MPDQDRALVTADLERLPGLRSRSWATDGAAFGVAASSGVGAAVLGLCALDGNVGPGIGAAAAIVGSAAALGAAFGKRWRRWLMRDGGAVTVKRWLRRLAVDGALAGGASSVLAISLLAAASGTTTVSNLFPAIAIYAGVGAVAGTTLLTTLGLPYALGLCRGRRPWRVLGAASLAGPPVLLAVLYGASRLLGW